MLWLLARLQVLRQTQALKESLGMSDSQAAGLAREVSRLRAAMSECQAAADANQQQVCGVAAQHLQDGNVIYNWTMQAAVDWKELVEHLERCNSRDTCSLNIAQ